MMIDSGARGNWNQLSQIAGIKGFRPYSVEDIIPYVITSNYKEGLSPLEYFVSASQMHQPLVHVTKLTTGAGWLMRRLADVAQDIVIAEDDCRTQDGIYVTAESINDMTLQFLEERIIGRISAEEIRCPETGEIFLEPDKEITEKIAKRIIESGIKKAKIRSILTCKSTFGVCAKCYGRDLARGEVVEKGEAVGIIAAQSIGGPTIQSVLDTRHSYRQMSDDNTQSILEIIRLFEGRIPKRSSINYHKILTESGLREAQLFLLNKFQSIYRLKNIVSADKHFEIIIRKMTEKIKVEDSGDTIFLRDEIVYRKVFYEENARVKYEGGRPAVGKPLILGITKTALLSDSWVSAAAFQETTKVLTTAAIAGAVDELQGLKENVIIGRLIPAGTGMPRCRNTFVKTD